MITVTVWPSSSKLYIVTRKQIHCNVRYKKIYHRYDKFKNKSKQESLMGVTTVPYLDYNNLVEMHLFQATQLKSNTKKVSILSFSIEMHGSK